MRQQTDDLSLFIPFQHYFLLLSTWTSYLCTSEAFCLHFCWNSTKKKSKISHFFLFSSFFRMGKIHWNKYISNNRGKGCLRNPLRIYTEEKKITLYVGNPLRNVHKKSTASRACTHKTNKHKMWHPIFNGNHSDINYASLKHRYSLFTISIVSYRSSYRNEVFLYWQKYFFDGFFNILFLFATNTLFIYHWRMKTSILQM